MGRSSGFPFPYPGRKRTATEKKGSSDKHVGPGISTSKAQRILGTVGDLNIDSPLRGDRVAWESFRPPSDGISVAVSESSQEDDMSYTSNNADWDESDIQLRGKASSTLLGHRYQDEATTDTSSLRRKLHTERSSSTLPSYYDRQTSPLLVSQQTSASSARDLALRKGFPPVITYPQSPLLQMGCLDPGSQLSENSPNGQSSKKKPARLDLSRLFPKPRKDRGPLLGHENLTRSPSIISQYSYDTQPSNHDGRRKLTRSESRSKKPARPLPRDKKSQASLGQRHKEGRLSDLYEHDENPPYGSPIPDLASIRSKSSPGQRTPRDDYHPMVLGMRGIESLRSPTSEEQTSSQNIGARIDSRPWETRSVTSISSRNTKGSRHTSASTISNSDLRNNSVLSISSDEDSDGRTNASGSWSINQSVSGPADRPKEIPPRSSSRAHNYSAKSSATNVSAPKRLPGPQDGNFPTIPLPPLAGSSLSGPWNPKKLADKRHSTALSRKDAAPISQAGPLRASHTQSPGSTEFRTISGRNSRLMAVTKQEEALLEALRQKRARMRETIIAEHETAKSPPRPSPSRNTQRDSKCSVDTVRGNRSSKSETVLMYLDAALSDAHEIDTAEPSPDLSDFLSFGSDEDDDSTPRTSWIAAKDRARADSVASPESEARTSPRTPQSAVRLSAVGALSGLREDRGDGKKGVAFLERVKSGSPEYLDDIDDVWGI